VRSERRKREPNVPRNRRPAATNVLANQTFVWYDASMAPATPPGRTRARVLRYVQRRLLSGQPPTVREVQSAFGFRAVQTAREHLENLVRDGRLTHRRGTARGYGLPAPPKQQSRWVPLLGAVQAGGLEQAIEDPQGYVSVQTRGRERLFALRVRGNSMSGVGILPGDTVIVRAQSTAQNGDIVVALVEDEATVKRLRLRQGRPELHAENPEFQPIVPDHPWTILGKVIEVHRNLEA